MAAPRRVTIAIVALVLCASPAAAGWPTQIETHVGATSARLYGNDVATTHAERVSLDVAGLWPLRRGLALDVEFGFTGRGGDTGVQPIDIDYGIGFGPQYVGSYDTRFDEDYLHVPVLLRMTPWTGRLRPAFVAGPDLAYKTGERMRVNRLQLGTEPMATTFMRPWDYGLVAGGGLEYDSSAGTWTLEGRYTWGLANVARPSSDMGTVRNRDFQLLLGLRQAWPWGK